MPALPSCLLEPAWDQFRALLPDRPEFDPGHPLGCHRRRIPDRVVFDHVIQALVHGSGYERISSPGCSDRTIRRRVNLWAQMGITQTLHRIALEAYDRMIGLDLGEISVDGCITKAPSGGEKAGRSPVDRGKQGLKRSVASDGCGVPLGIVSDGANRHDSPLLGPTLEAAREQVGALPEAVNVNLDRSYDSAKSRVLIAELGFTVEIARKGVPAPVQAGKRWVVERTHSWMNDYGRLRRCTDRSGEVVDFYLYLAAALVTLRMLIRRSTSRYRWDNRPTTRRLK
ncbi:IS5 family transposase [Streptomyces sp. AP-93]|uniref:IS5 family transposase n=1 Tax=Streptomyces sp. AP-93 TaxID=2929048 RepID=UPI001FAFCFB3|nr:IS5 family transposase [Streptomyces sp. AP-93]MCJ0874310.1 IS5 family transposase [Streptomyces sp. AP-93]